MAIVERLQLIVEAAGTGRVANDMHKVGGSIKGLGQAAKGGERSLSGLANAAGISGAALKAGLAAGATIAGSALLALATRGVDTFIKLAEEVRKVQNVTGATAEDASRLVAVADDLGVSVDAVATGTFNLGRNIDKLPSLGVKIAKDARGLTDIPATLANVAAAYNATADPARRATLVQTAFGRSGKQLIPILQMDKQAIEEMYASAEGRGLILSQQDLDMARQYALAMDDLADLVQGFMVSVGRELVPVLSDFAVVVGKVTDGTDNLNNSLLGKGFGLLFKFGTLFGVVSTGLDLMAGKEGDVAEATREANAAIDEQVEDLDALLKATMASTSANRALEQASRGVATANRSLADAQDNLNDLLAEGAVDEEKVANARRSLAEATRSAAAADRSLAKAQREYDEALAASTLLGGDTQLDALTDASDNLADAKDASTSAHERETEAAKELQAAQRGDPEFQDKLADARWRVEDATRGVADAEYNLAQRSYEAVKAHDAEAAAISGKAGTVKALRGELETLMALNPEQAPFLSQLLGGLQPGATAAPMGPSGSAVLSGAAAGAAAGVTTTTNNVTINAPQQADPIHIAREVVWALN